MAIALPKYILIPTLLILVASSTSFPRSLHTTIAVKASSSPSQRSFLCNGTIACLRRALLRYTNKENTDPSTSNAVKPETLKASIRPNHKFVSVALKAALGVVHESRALGNACLQRNLDASLHVLEIQAIEDCSTLMDNAYNQLNRAISHLIDVFSGPRFEDKVLDQSQSSRELYEDLFVWLSTALTFQTTCSDGFHFVKSGRCTTAILRAQEKVSRALVDGLDVLKRMAMGARMEEEEEMVGIGHAIRSRGNGRKKKRTTPPSTCIEEKSLQHPDIWPWVVNSPKMAMMMNCVRTAPLAVGGWGASADIIVAQDGTGHYTNITDALQSINASSAMPHGRLTVYIRQGVYNESLEVPKTLPNLTLVGDGINATIITGNKNVGSGLFNTLRTSTVGIVADGFMARDITFQNTAGPAGYQAVALRVEGDMAVFYRCSFEGYQDTLYALAGRQFYRDCQIYGTVDFIFGNAIASFQSCQLLARRPLKGQQNTITAQGRRVIQDISGFSFQNCTLVASNELMSAPFRVQTYLGRPWKPYSRTIFLQSFLDGIIDPAGWLPWNSSNPYNDTVYYAEYQNRGPGSPTSNRVHWLGVHPSINWSDALQFTADNFILGSTWLPLTQISYTSGLSSDPQH